VNPITEAASVLLARGPGSSEVFAVRRAESLRFFGGFFAFPGGKVSEEDVPQPASPAASDLGVRRLTAARELFEETGVLVARRPDGSFASSGPELAQARRELVEGSLLFAGVLQRFGAAVHGGDFRHVGRLVTPPFTTMRFDTVFFQADLPPGQQPEVWPGELDHGRWTTAEALLDEWTRGDCPVSPPTLTMLEAIRGRPVLELAERLAPLLASLDAGAIHPIFWAPWVQMLPLQTIALAPSTHTNAFLVGRDPAYLFDPGPEKPEEQQRLFAVLDARREAGQPPTAVVLTHHHPDHVGAAPACSRRYGIPVWAHAATARALAGKVQVSRFLDDGDRIELGPTPDGRASWRLETIHTPGHAAGHLAFYDPHYRLLFAGDMVSTLSSIIIAPPDGDLTVYLASLRRLQTYDSRLLLPSHGSASTRPGQTLEEAIAHRAKREEQLLAVLGLGPRRVQDLLSELYKGLPESLTRLAELQTLAGLEKLQREGRVAAAVEGGETAWVLRTPST
jgi:endoribonuclease LACTB2